MAVIIYKPMTPLNKVIQEWVNEAEAQLVENMNTQFIWPVEVYPGYRDVNEKRKKQGGWYSTGQGEKSIGGRVVNASNPGNVTVLFHWNDYLDFVDRGVGKGRPSQSVDRERKAHFQDRYIGMWNTRGASKQTSRPAFLWRCATWRAACRNTLKTTTATKVPSAPSKPSITFKSTSTSTNRPLSCMLLYHSSKKAEAQVPAFLS